jgi:hypothetical protein
MYRESEVFEAWKKSDALNCAILCDKLRIPKVVTFKVKNATAICVDYKKDYI